MNKTTRKWLSAPEKRFRSEHAAGIGTGRSPVLRAVSLLLCLALLLPLLGGLRQIRADDPESITPGTQDHTADGSTMDTYAASLNLDSDSRYAGRIWADKTTFANTEPSGDFDGTILSLDMEHDGCDGEVSIEGGKDYPDFLHVFSAVGSSQVMNGESQVPLDVVFIVDTSASMSSEGASRGGYPNNERFYRTGLALNAAATALMDANPNNRFGVVQFNSGSSTVLELDHYGPVNGTYFTPTEQNGGTEWGIRYLWRTISIKVTKDNRIIEASMRPRDPVTTDYDGGMTNTQAGLYTGMNMLASRKDTKIWVNANGDVVPDGTPDAQPIQRLPIVIMISDGLPTRSSPSEDWWEPDTRSSVAQGTRLSSSGFAAHAMLALAVGSYMKMAINRTYFDGKSFGDTTTDPNYVTRVYTFGLLNEQTPEDKAWAELVMDPGNNLGKENADASIDNYWDIYVRGGAPTMSAGDENYTMNHGAPYDNELIQAGLNYVDKYQQTNPDALEASFKQLIHDLQAQAPFIPIRGNNDLSVKNALTYRDPIGRYMEIKDVKNVLLFGKLYNLKKADKLEYFTKEGTPGTAGNYAYYDEHYYIDEFELVFDRMNGDPRPAGRPVSAGAPDSYGDELIDDVAVITDEKKGDEGYRWRTLIRTWTKYKYRDEFYYNADGKPKYKSQMVSSCDRTATGTSYGSDYVGWSEPIDWRYSDWSAWSDWQVITWYEWGYDADGNEGWIPEGGDLWDAEQIVLKEKEIQNPCYTAVEGREDSKVTFRLSDIEIYVRTTKDFIDPTLEGSEIQADPGEDQSLYVSIPSDALPLQVVTINKNTENGQTTYSYSHNLDDKTQSTPFRVFYTVGMVPDVMKDERVDLTRISSSYLKENKKKESVYFYSNWYNKRSTYGDYVTDGSAYTYGEAALTFSPADENRYYVFQKILPLYEAEGVNKDNFAAAADGGVVTWDGSKWIFSGQAPVSGVSVGNQITSVTDASSKDYFFIVVDYFSSTGEVIHRAVPRMGKEFGSGVGGTDTAGEYLCWYNPQTLDTKPFSESTEPGSPWILATKIGGLRTGDMEQDVKFKTLHKTGDTAETYYLPTVSRATGKENNSNAGEDVPSGAADEAQSDNRIVVDVYLGNNARLTVTDTQLMVTKEVETESVKTRSFHYVATLTKGGRNVSKTISAIELYQEEPGEGEDKHDKWRAMIKRVELLTNNKGLLMGDDGKPAIIDGYYLYIGDDPDSDQFTYTLFPKDGVNTLPPDFPLTVKLLPTDEYEKEESEWTFAGEREITAATVDLDAPIGLEVASDYEIRTTYKTQDVTFENGVAEFDLEHRRGLLLTGLDTDMAYTVKEVLTDEQYKDGVRLKQIDWEQYEWATDTTLDELDSACYKANETHPSGANDPVNFDRTNHSYAISGTTDENMIDHVHFDNEAITTSLEISKRVETVDDMGKDDAFEFTISFESLPAGTYHGYIHSTGHCAVGDGKHPHSAAGTSEEWTDLDLKASGTGGAEQSVTLKNGQTYVIEDLPPNAEYKFTVDEVLPFNGAEAEDEHGYKYKTTVTATGGGTDPEYSEDGRSVKGSLPDPLTPDTAYTPGVRVSYINEVVPIRWSFKFTKVDDLDWEQGIVTVLDGAEFSLYRELKQDETVAGEDHIEFDGSEWDFHAAVISDENGAVAFTNLPRRRFILKETKAPKGHVLPTGFWVVEMGQDDVVTWMAYDADGKQTGSVPPDFVRNSGQDDDGLYLPNDRLLTLPATGSADLVLLCGFAAVLAFAGMILGRKKKKHN